MTINSKAKSRKKVLSCMHCLVMMTVAVIMFLPFAWILSTSLRLPKDSFLLPPSFLPTEFRIENYIEVFEVFPFSKYFMNSLFVATLSTFLQVIATAFAAYGFSRINFRFRNILFIVLLSGLMIPAQSTIVPVFIQIKEIKLYNTLWALILPALYNPSGLFLTRQFMMTIPKSYDEAAYVDGAGRMRIFMNVILPMSKAPIAMVAVNCFIVKWNDFFSPLIFLSDNEKLTLPLALVILRGSYGSGSLSVVLAGVVISMIAPLLLYIFGQKYLMGGVMTAGLKS